MFHSRPFTLFMMLLLVVFSTVAMAPSVAAEPERTLILGGPVFPTGWMYLDNGEVGGERPELFDAIARHAGFTWRGELFPAKRLMLSIVQGKVDLSMLVHNPLLDDSERVLTSSEPIYTENLNVYGQKGSPQVAYRSDLQGKSIVVMRGYGYGGFKNWLDDPNNQIKQHESNSFEGAILMLLRRNLDYALLYDLNFEAGLQALRSAQDHEAVSQASEFTVTTWSKVPVHFHLSRMALPDAEQVLEKLMNSFHTLQSEGVLPPVETLDMPGDRP